LATEVRAPASQHLQRYIYSFSSTTSTAHAHEQKKNERRDCIILGRRCRR